MTVVRLNNIMELSSSYNLTSAIINQLNGNQSNLKIVTEKISSGKSVEKPQDNVGAYSVNTKVSYENRQNLARAQNLQNLLSFVQVQDGALKIVGDILSRSSQLKSLFESATANVQDKLIYDEEFKELQMQLKNIRDQKFNGVSLFSGARQETIFEKAIQENSLAYNGNTEGSEIAINRSGFLKSIKVTKEIESDPVITGASSGGPEEQRINISLKNTSGELTFWQWAHREPDNFRAYHGGDLIHDKDYGRTWEGHFLNDGRFVNGGGSLVGPFPGDPKPPQYDLNMDVIPFGRTGNQSTTITLIMNESGSTKGSTGWDIAYKIDYDPITQNLSDDSKVWSLRDFNMNDFKNLEEILIDARGQNAASQQRIMGHIGELQKSQISSEYFLEKSEGLDIASSMASLNQIKTRLTVNANLLKAAQDMENKLFTDFL